VIRSGTVTVADHLGALMGDAAVVLLSGGLDSTVLLWWARGHYDRVRCIGVDYGQAHSRELRHARHVARLAGTRFDLVDVGVPEPETEPSTKTLFIRGRNVLAVAVAASVVGHGGADVLVGSLATDSHADCKQPFFDEMTRVLAGPESVGQVRVRAPLLAQPSKSAVAELGFRLGAPLNLTWSCMLPSGTRQCGLCPPCATRVAALRDLPGRVGIGADEIAAWTHRFGSPGHDQPAPPPPSHLCLVDELTHWHGSIPWRRGWRYIGPDGTQRFTPFCRPGARIRRAFGSRDEDRYLRVAEATGDRDPAWELTILADGTVTRATGDPSAAESSLAAILAEQR
jgi:7-cyano-7-deazaguanine synthase